MIIVNKNLGEDEINQSKLEDNEIHRSYHIYLIISKVLY